jgi:hypothetical protein
VPFYRHHMRGGPVCFTVDLIARVLGAGQEAISRLYRISHHFEPNYGAPYTMRCHTFLSSLYSRRGKRGKCGLDQQTGTFLNSHISHIHLDFAFRMLWRHNLIWPAVLMAEAI